MRGQFLQRAVADAALGRGDGADEGGIVVRVGDQAQVGGEVLDLGVVEERGAAADGVRHLVRAQLFLEHARQMVAAVEDGVIGEARAVLELVRQQAQHHRFRFVLFVLRREHAHRIAGAVLAPQVLLEQLGVVLDQVVGALQDALRGAVVLLQLDDAQGGVVLLQVAQVGGAGAAPGVDGLVVVAHRGERGTVARQQLHHLVLAIVGVLVFVDQQVAEAMLPALVRFLMVLEQFHRQADEVVEVHRLIGAQRFLIARVEQGEALLFLVLGQTSRLFRREEGGLPVRHHALRAAYLLLVRAAQQFADDLAGVGAIENGELFLVAEQRRFLAQDLHAQRVEGADGHALGIAPVHDLADALAHLVGGLVGEGDGGDVARRIAAFLDEVGQLVGDDARLAAARTGQHQQGAIEIFYCFALRGIEFA